MASIKPTYSEYERRRLDHPKNQLEGIRSMFRRSFGASTFGGFWRYWNPLFSYYLYFYCYKPLKRFLGRPWLVLITFTLSGALHDLFASLILLEPYLLFTPVFAFWGMIVLIEEACRFNYSSFPFWMRSSMYGLLIIGSIVLGIYLRAIIIE